MGAGQLTGVMLMVCIWLLMVAAQNLIKNPRDQKTEHALLINEINADNPGEDTSEFVELYHTSGQAAPLDGYYLIFYNGNGNLAYRILNLKGYTTDSQGFFLIGSSTVQPRPSVIFPKNTIQNGPDAIALYYGKENFQEGMHVTSDGLVDALVHKSKKTDRADVLLSVLTPDRDAFLEDPSFRILDESIERCRGTDSQWVFQVAMPSPGRDNHCIPSSQLNASAALINEVHPMSFPGEFEFIELQGPPSTMLRDLVLVLIEGLTKEVYFFMDVYGKTSPDGLLLIGSVQDKTPGRTPDFWLLGPVHICKMGLWVSDKQSICPSLWENVFFILGFYSVHFNRSTGDLRCYDNTNKSPVSLLSCSPPKYIPKVNLLEEFCVSVLLLGVLGTMEDQVIYLLWRSNEGG